MLRKYWCLRNCCCIPVISLNASELRILGTDPNVSKYTDELQKFAAVTRSLGFKRSALAVRFSATNAESLSAADRRDGSL